MTRNSKNITNSKEAAPNYIIRTSQFSSALLNPDLETPKGVGEKDGTPAPKRFGVYRNNVVVSLIEALKAAYPSIANIMGEKNFQQIARFYVSEHPPRSAMMQIFGSEFPQFIENLPPLKNAPFLVDVARAEKAWLKAYHTHDAKPLNLETLRKFSPEETMQLTFTTHPASHLIKSKYPVNDLFDFRNEKPENGVDMQMSQHLLITRPHLSVFTTALNNTYANFFDLILRGETLGNAIGTSLKMSDEFDAGQAISLLIQTGAVTSTKVNTNLDTKVHTKTQIQNNFKHT